MQTVPALILRLRERAPDIVAIDGKTSRRTHARAKGRKRWNSQVARAPAKPIISKSAVAPIIIREAKRCRRQLAVGDRLALSDQLVETLFGDYAVALHVGIDAVIAFRGRAGGGRSDLTGAYNPFRSSRRLGPCLISRAIASG